MSGANHRRGVIGEEGWEEDWEGGLVGDGSVVGQGGEGPFATTLIDLTGCTQARVRPWDAACSLAEVLLGDLD